MKRPDHYIISTKGECNAALFRAPLYALIVLCVYFFIYPSIIESNRFGGGRFVFITALFSVTFCSYLYIFLRYLRKKKHAEDHIFIDISQEGIIYYPQQESGKNESFIFLWEDIEYIIFHVSLDNFLMYVKPYKKKRVKVEFSYRSWEPVFPGLYKTIRSFSKRNDIIKEEHIRPFA